MPAKAPTIQQSPSQAPAETTVGSFKEFGLPAQIERALTELRFEKPTPIQARAIPPALEGKDLIGVAQTGTGKTAAFSLPTLTRLLASPGKTALVLAPTRELALQIDDLWRKLTQHLPQMRSAVLIGGTAMQPQTRALQRQPRMIIATPGRLVDHLQRRSARLADLAVLVLDEADRMLDMGFAPQLSEILKHVPRERQTLFFTATWANELDQLSKKYLRAPVRVTVGSVSRAAPLVTQSLVSTTVQGKNEALLAELKTRQGSVLIFTRTKSRTDRVARFLAGHGVEVNRIHGGRSQGQRNSALAAFREGDIRVLVATDIAARGIDVADIAHVVNYDLPQSPDDYIHRIGRTGRAGATGQAVSLVTPEDRAQWREITRLLERTGSQLPSQAFEAFQTSQTSPKSATKTAPKAGGQPRQENAPQRRSSWQKRRNSGRMAGR